MSNGVNNSANTSINVNTRISTSTETSAIEIFFLKLTQNSRGSSNRGRLTHLLHLQDMLIQSQGISYSPTRPIPILAVAIDLVVHRQYPTKPITADEQDTTELEVVIKKALAMKLYEFLDFLIHADFKATANLLEDKLKKDYVKHYKQKSQEDDSFFVSIDAEDVMALSLYEIFSLFGIPKVSVKDKHPGFRKRVERLQEDLDKHSNNVFMKWLQTKKNPVCKQTDNAVEKQSEVTTTEDTRSINGIAEQCDNKSLLYKLDDYDFLALIPSSRWLLDWVESYMQKASDLPIQDHSFGSIYSLLTDNFGTKKCAAQSWQVPNYFQPDEVKEFREIYFEDLRSIRPAMRESLPNLVSNTDMVLKYKNYTQVLQNQNWFKKITMNGNLETWDAKSSEFLGELVKELTEKNNSNN